MGQLDFPEFRKSRRGGARRGAGRKPSRKPSAGSLRNTPHRARPAHCAAHPVHVTLRAALRSLRSQHVAPTVLGALRDSQRDGFRIAHYSVQANHVHLIVEARDAASLSSGVRGLVVRVAKRVNRLLFRSGRFWADRWHGRDLTGPRQVRNALVYVLQNHQKHASAGVLSRLGALDPLSSAEWFDGFVGGVPRGFRCVGPPCIDPPETWLLSRGWQRHGRILPSESPVTKFVGKRPN